MKLSASQIDQAKANPRRFVGNMGKPFRMRPHFRMYFCGAIARYFKGMAEADALDYFNVNAEEKLQSQLYFTAHLNRYRQSLLNFFENFPDLDLLYLRSAERFTLNLGNHRLSGQVEAIHAKPFGGYAVTMTEKEASDWTNSLKWPLVQAAIASKMNGDPSEVEIVSYSMMDLEFSRHCFPTEVIDAAKHDAESVIENVESIRAEFED